MNSTNAKSDLLKLLNVAVIGAGYWGKKVLYEYVQVARNDSTINLPLVADTSETELKYCERVYSLPRENLVKDYREFLNSRNIHAVHICTPNESHHEICKEALDAGKHVLLEKPMTLSSEEAYELVELAKSRDLVLQIGLIFRFSNAIRKIREMLLKEFFGQIYYLKFQWTTLTEPFRDRDIITDLAPHPIDIINYLFDKWPQKVMCKAKAYQRKNHEEMAYIIFEIGDIIAHIELSWLQPGKIREITVMGSERCSIVNCLNQAIRVYEKESNQWFDLDLPENNTILTEIRYFLDHILGTGESINGALVGAKNVEVIEYVKRSLNEERMMHIPSI